MTLSVTLPDLFSIPTGNLLWHLPPPPHVQVLHIGHPRIEPSEDKVRLIADIRIGTDDCRPLWVEFDKEYAQYLCDERSDAFLIGLLLYAMFNRLDIVCEAPVTAQLLYQLRTYLIPALAHNSAVLHETQISASLAEAPMPNAGGVGASCSCGVDSLYSIKNNMASPYPGQSITHLCVNNTGHMNTREQYLWLLDHAKAFAKEYGFKLIISDSNIARDFRLNVRHMNTYPTSFVVCALQKLWSIYYLASDGYGLAEFSVKNLEDVFDAHHELLSLDSFPHEGSNSIPTAHLLHVMKRSKTCSTGSLHRNFSTCAWPSAALIVVVAVNVCEP